MTRDRFILRIVFCQFYVLFFLRLSSFFFMLKLLLFFADCINIIVNHSLCRIKATHLFGPDVGHEQRVLVHMVRLGGRPYGGDSDDHHHRDQRPRVRDRQHDAAATVALTYGRDCKRACVHAQNAAAKTGCPRTTAERTATTERAY